MYEDGNKDVKEEPQNLGYKNKGRIQITFTNYAIRITGKLSISKEMQKKFKVKSLNFLIPKKLEKLVNIESIKMKKIGNIENVKCI